MNDRRNLINEMQGRWVEYYYSLGIPALTYACDKLGENVPCPVEGGTDGFRLFKDAHTNGGGVKQSQGPFPSGFGLLMWLEDKTAKDVAKDLFAFLDDGNSTTRTFRKAPLKVKSDPQMDQKIEVWVKGTWERAITPNEKHYSMMNYLATRGIKASALGCSALKFAFLRYTHKGDNLGKFPTMIAKVTNNDGEFVGLHRTYLGKDGSKADISYHGETLPARKLTSSIKGKSKGRMIRLFELEHAQVIHVAEGLETALSALQVHRKPTYSLINATNYGTFLPPKSVNTIHNWVDKDVSKTGETAALKFTKRMNALGIRVINHLPSMPIPEGEKSIDWNNVLLIHPSAFFIN